MSTVTPREPIDQVGQRASASSIASESHIIGEDDANKVWLKELPDSGSVSISGTPPGGGGSYTEVGGTPAASGEFKVNDTAGARLAQSIEFHSSDNGGSIAVSYDGLGGTALARDFNRLNNLLDALGTFPWDADPTGASDARSALNTAISVGGDIIITGVYRLSSDLTFPSTVRLVFRNGGQIKPDSGVTATYECPIVAEDEDQIFSGNGDHDLSGAPIPYLSTEWFPGAQLEDRITNAMAAAGSGDTILPPSGAHTVDQVTVTKGVRLEGYNTTLNKDATTTGHMFVDTAGAAHGFEAVGLTINLNRASFTNGDTVSAFHFVRTNNLTFEDLYIYDGIEEGLKLYNCQHTRVHRCRFENIRNNGIQWNSLADTILLGAAADIYTGAGSYQRAKYLWITESWFKDIDDGLEGSLEGQGVSFGSTLADEPVSDVFVIGNHFEDCLRGIWSENNASATPGENIQVVGNSIHGGDWHGIGFLAVRGGVIADNVIRDIGVKAPGGGTSSDVFGIRVGGSADPQSYDVTVVGNSVIETRTGGSAFMLDGISVVQANRVTVEGNEVHGQTDKEYDIDEGSTTDVTIMPSRTPSTELSHSTGYSSANGWDNVEWDTEDEDVGGMFDSGVSATRVTPTIKGRYLVTVNIVFPTSASLSIAGIRIVYTPDGGGDSVVREILVPANGGSDDTSLEATAHVEMGAGDDVRVQAYQDTGSALTLSTRSVLAVRKIK